MRLGGRAGPAARGRGRAPCRPAPLSGSWGNQLLMPSLFFFSFAWKLLSALQLDMDVLCLKDTTVRSFGVGVRQGLRDLSRQIAVLRKTEEPLEFLVNYRKILIKFFVLRGFPLSVHLQWKG